MKWHNFNDSFVHFTNVSVGLGNLSLGKTYNQIWFCPLSFRYLNLNGNDEVPSNQLRVRPQVEKTLVSIYHVVTSFLVLYFVLSRLAQYQAPTQTEESRLSPLLLSSIWESDLCIVTMWVSDPTEIRS